MHAGGTEVVTMRTYSSFRPAVSRAKSPDRRKREAQGRQLADILGSDDWDVVGGKRVSHLSLPVDPPTTCEPVASLLAAMRWAGRAGAILGWLVLLTWLVKHGCR